MAQYFLKFYCSSEIAENYVIINNNSVARNAFQTCFVTFELGTYNQWYKISPRLFTNKFDFIDYWLS